MGRNRIFLVKFRPAIEHIFALNQRILATTQYLRAEFGINSPNTYYNWYESIN